MNFNTLINNISHEIKDATILTRLIALILLILISPLLVGFIFLTWLLTD